MPTALAWLGGVLIFIIILTVSIALHEAGHMQVARWLKIPVPRYFVGFGPTVWSKHHNGTEYGIKAIPLGGFINVEDRTQPEGSPERSLLSHVPPWKRILIFLAGPAVNIVLGVAIIFVMLYTTPLTIVTTKIDTVASCENGANCAASKAGILPGDKVVEVDGRKISKIEDMQAKFKPEGSSLVVERNGERLPVTVKANKQGMIGMNMLGEERSRTIAETTSTIGSVVVSSVKTIPQIPSKIPNIVNSIRGTEERSHESMSSVVGIGRTYGDTSASTEIDRSSKARMFAIYGGLFNLGLGIANLLPLMPLDGGRIAVAMMDSVKIRLDRIRKREHTPVGYKVVGAITVATGSVVIAFMLLLIVADIVAPIKVI